MRRALVLVDLQQDYFPGGAFPLDGPEAAVASARTVLDRARGAGDLVVHVRHAAPEPDATFLLPGTPGAELHPAVAPRPGEPVFEKGAPNAFHGTGLQRLLEDAGVTHLVVVGMMSSMCIDSTVRAAAELGFDVTVVPDACAAPDLAFGGRRISGAVVHAAFMAALGSAFAAVVPSPDLDRHLRAQADG